MQTVFVAPCMSCFCMRCKRDISAEVDAIPITGPDPMDDYVGFDSGNDEFLLGHICYDCDWEMEVFECADDYYFGELMDQ